jgi:hypothetical protein
VIRRATHEDVVRIVEFGAAFHAYSPYKDIEFDAGAFGAFCGRMIEAGVILLSDTGMIAGLLNPLYFNPAVVMAAELLWWAPEGGGRELREAFEAWAAEAGAQGVQFSSLVDDRAERVRLNFERAGYAPIETAFLKRF